jgi:ABC-type branched-subunit amino acid transport system ATPase component
VTSAAILTCSEVEVAYDKVKVLFGVDLEVHQGEIVALLGTNGSGKSTLLKAISGLVDPFCGEIIFDGVNITHSSPVEIARLGIVHVPGGKAVFPTLTVAEHFKAAAWLYAKEPVEVIAARIEYVLDLFPRLRERLHGIAGNLSGGEQQQLGLGMAFVAKPKLLVIDELSLGLAPSVVERLLRVVREIHAGGCSVLIVEQSVNVALTIADRAYFLEKGEVRFSGPTADLLDREDVLRSVFLEGAASGGRSHSDEVLITQVAPAGSSCGRGVVEAFRRHPCRRRSQFWAEARPNRGTNRSKWGWQDHDIRHDFGHCPSGRWQCQVSRR